MPVLPDLFNLTRLSQDFDLEEGLLILERDQIARLGKTRMQSLAVGPQQNA